MSNVNDDGDNVDLEIMDFFEEDLATSAPTSKLEEIFDETIGHIEDIIMDENFQTLQTSFMEEYYSEFEDAEENKFVYTDVHHNYIKTIEHFMEKELMARIPDFSMEAFLSELSTKELEGEVFEVLLTFTDFAAFKEMMVEYRNTKEGKGIDLSDGIRVTPMSR